MRWRYVQTGILLLFCFILGFNIIIPFFDKRSFASASTGDISNAVTSSWEYDGQEGRYPDAIKLSSDGTYSYFAIVSTGDTGAQNFLYIRTIKVWDSNGTISPALVDALAYNGGVVGTSPSIVNVGTNMYAISYAKTTVVTAQYVITVGIDATGNIDAGGTDTLTLSQAPGIGTHSKIISVSGNVYAVAYSAGGTDLWLETLNITSAGSIDATTADTQEINTSDGIYPDMCLVDSDTVAIVYDGGTAGGNDGYISTWNITSTGVITNTYASQWEFDTSKGGTPTIAKVSGNIFMLAYENTNADLYVKTLTIADSGAITKAWVDTQAIDITNGDYPTFFNVSVTSTANTWVKGITFSGEGSDGYVSTFDVTSTGAIGSEIDTLEIVPADAISWFLPTCFVSDDYYLSIHDDSVNDGWAKTFEIETYVPPSWKNTASGYFTFGNTPTWKNTANGYFTFGNTNYTPVYDNMSQGYFTFGNTPSWKGLDGYFTFGNSPTWKGVDGYFTFGNTPTWQGSDGYFTFGNTASWQGPEGYFTFGNTSGWQLETDGYFTFGNTVIFQIFDEGYFTFGNAPSWSGEDGYFTFANSPSWSGEDGYFTFGNASTFKGEEGWFTFGNGAWHNTTQGWFTFGAPRTWSGLAQGYFTFGNSTAWDNVTDGYFNFSNNVSWQGPDGYFTFANSPIYNNIDTGWFSFLNAVNYQNVSQGWFNFSNNVSWQGTDGYFTFGNGAWQSIEQGWFTFENVSTWHTENEGWFSFGNTSYMIIVSLFPDDGDLICPTCYENDTFFYFNINVSHYNGTLMDITWSLWDGTIIGQLNNVGNGTRHIVPDEALLPIIYGSTFNYTVNVTDGSTYIEKTITFGTDTEVNCMQFLWNMTQFGILLTLGVFMFFFVVGYWSKKRSGGFFLILAGFAFITFAISANAYLNILITGMLIPFGVFIALLGVKKAFYNEEATEQEQANAQSQAKRRKR